MRLFVLFVLLIVVGGCISNDVPFPVIYGNVQKIEFNGQQKCVINSKTRTIELVLSDTVNIKRVRLNTLDISADPAREQEVLITPEVSVRPDTFLDLSTPFRFTIRTYQDYVWTITTQQTIEHYFKIEHQVGDAVINTKEKMVVVYLERGQDLSNVKVLDVQLGPSIATYQPDPSSMTDFVRKQSLLVSCFGQTEKWEISMFYKDLSDNPSEEELTGSVDAWAKIAYLNGHVPVGEGGTPAFEYKLAKASSWTKVNAVANGKKFSAKITGLTPNSNYVFRALVGTVAGKEMAFTTERTEQIEYSNFDTWYTRVASGNNYDTPGIEGRVIWDSGNQGGASFNQIPTTKETTDVVHGSAACLSSRWAVMKFAAGSLYTGKFGGLDGLNAKLDFGIPYTCRPTKLTGYYKYKPGVIDRVPDGSRYAHLMGKTDSCHIYIALCDWTGPFLANSKTETFVDFSTNNSSILAYGELKSDHKMSSYEKFTIDIKYRDTTRKPTYILIVCTSSKYGDYFVGSTSSVLLLDEFELGFD